MAKEYSTREDIYRYEVPDEMADVRIIALMMESRTGILASLTAIAHGEAPAPDPPPSS
jgi:hypothetical protein